MFSVTKQATGADLRMAREAKGLTLRAMARLLKVSPATVSAIEHDRTRLTVERLQQIAELVDIPASRLLEGRVAEPESGNETPTIPVLGGWRRYDDLDLGPVLASATRLFVQQGFHATSMREVAAGAGLSVAGVYHHYPSKEQILIALLDFTMAEISWRLVAARDAGDAPVKSFGLMVESLALFHAVRGDLAFLGASEMRALSGDDLTRITGLRDEVQHLLDDQAALAFPSVEVLVACRAIATMCASLPSWFKADGPLGPEQVAEAYAGYALGVLNAAWAAGSN